MAAAAAADVRRLVGDAASRAAAYTARSAELRVALEQAREAVRAAATTDEQREALAALVSAVDVHHELDGYFMTAEDAQNVTRALDGAAAAFIAAPAAAAAPVLAAYRRAKDALRTALLKSMDAHDGYPRRQMFQAAVATSNRVQQVAPGMPGAVRAAMLAALTGVRGVAAGAADGGAALAASIDECPPGALTQEEDARLHRHVYDLVSAAAGAGRSAKLDGAVMRVWQAALKAHLVSPAVTAMHNHAEDLLSAHERARNKFGSYNLQVAGVQTRLTEYRCHLPASLEARSAALGEMEREWARVALTPTKAVKHNTNLFELQATVGALRKEHLNARHDLERLRRGLPADQDESGTPRAAVTKAVVGAATIGGVGVIASLKAATPAGVVAGAVVVVLSLGSAVLRAVSDGTAARQKAAARRQALEEAVPTGAAVLSQHEAQLDVVLQWRSTYDSRTAALDAEIRAEREEVNRLLREQQAQEERRHGHGARQRAAHADQQAHPAPAGLLADEQQHMAAQAHAGNAVLALILVAISVLMHGAARSS